MMHWANNKGVSVKDAENFTTKNVMYYVHTDKELKGTVKSKALKFVEFGLVKNAGSDWFVKPIEGYNNTTYLIQDGECNCQGFQTKKRKGEFAHCSHTLAVEYYKKINKIS